MKKSVLLFNVILVLGLVLTTCTPAPMLEEVEVTREVEVEKPAEVEVEVTRKVEVEKPAEVEVEVTRKVEIEKVVTATPAPEPAKEPTAVPELSGPLRLFSEEGQRYPLFSAQDGITYIQSKANGFLSTFYGQVDPLHGYQVTGADYSVTSISSADNLIDAEYELTFWAIHEGEEIVLSGPAGFFWEQEDSLVWRLGAEMDLSTASGERVDLTDIIVVQYLDNDSYQVSEVVMVDYTVDLVLFNFWTGASTRVSRSANEIAAYTEQEAKVSSGGSTYYAESNTVDLRKVIHDEGYTEMWGDAVSDNNAGVHQEGHAHQHVYHSGESVEITIDEFWLDIGGKTVSLVNPIGVYVEERSTDEFLVYWDLSLESSAGSLPLIATEARFRRWEDGDGKIGIAEELVVGVPDEGYEEDYSLYIDPPGLKDWLITKACATVSGAVAGATAAALTTWWTGPGTTVTMPTGALIGAIAGDLGYNAVWAAKKALRRAGIIKDETPPVIGIGLLKDPYWETTVVGGVDVRRLRADFHITAIEDVSGVDFIEEKVGASPRVKHSGNGGTKYTYRFYMVDNPGDREFETGQIQVKAQNVDGYSLSVTQPSIKVSGSDTTRPTLTLRFVKATKHYLEGYYDLVYEATATDKESGLRRWVMGQKDWSFEKGASAASTAIDPVGRVAHTWVITMYQTSVNIDSSNNLWLVAEDVMGNTQKVWIEAYKNIPKSD
jgi:hypothetical protein